MSFFNDYSSRKVSNPLFFRLPCGLLFEEGSSLELFHLNLVVSFDPDLQVFLECFYLGVGLRVAIKIDPTAAVLGLIACLCNYNPLT